MDALIETVLKLNFSNKIKRIILLLLINKSVRIVVDTLKLKS